MVMAHCAFNVKQTNYSWLVFHNIQKIISVCYLLLDSIYLYICLFICWKAYEARLFLLTKGDNIASAEEALDLQKQKFALNRFFGDLAHGDKNVRGSDMGKKEKRHREAKSSVVVSF